MDVGVCVARPSISGSESFPINKLRTCTKADNFDYVVRAVGGQRFWRCWIKRTVTGHSGKRSKARPEVSQHLRRRPSRRQRTKWTLQETNLFWATVSLNDALLPTLAPSDVF